MASKTAKTLWWEQVLINILHLIGWMIKKTFFILMIAVLATLEVILEYSASASKAGKEYFKKELRK